MKKILETLKLKWAEYLLEIIVIMIGILGAFTLSNWNEERKNAIQETQLLKELIVNLNANLEEFDQNIEIQKNIILNIDQLLDHIENDKPYHDSLNFRQLLYLEQISVSTSAYETLKSIGLNNIRSESLRMEIIQLFEMTYSGVINLIEDVAMQRYSVTRDIFNKYFRTNRELVMVAVPMDYESLQHSQEFINWVYNRRAWKRAVIDLNQELIDPTNSLIENVNEYLGN